MSKNIPSFYGDPEKAKQRRLESMKDWPLFQTYRQLDRGVFKRSPEQVTRPHHNHRDEVE